jgi:hypothetical protein
LTFGNLADEIGRTSRSKIMATLAHHAQVRVKDFFGNNLFLQKVAIPCDFDEI